MWLLPNVRTADISKSDRDLFERYGEAVIARVLSSIGSPAQELYPVASDKTKYDAARDWLTERGDTEARRIREDRLLELAIIVLIGIEIALSIIFFVWGLRESRQSGTAQIQAMQTMQQSLETTRQALDMSVTLATKQLGLMQGMVDPALEISLGDIFKPELSNEITIRNTGPQSVQDLSVDLRCFAFRDYYDKSPILLFQGAATADAKHHWWYAPELRSGAAIQKDASSALNNLFSNAEKMIKQRPGVSPSVDELDHPLPLASRELLVVDFNYHRVVDNRKYAESRTGWLLRDSKTSKAVLVTSPPVSTELQGFLSRMP